MTPALWHTVHDTGALADLTSHVRLRLAGPDAIRYLNGQVTQDVRKLRPGLALPACLTDHKGKLQAYVSLSAPNVGELLLSAPADLRPFLLPRLEKYLIADDCVLEDLTDNTALVHLIAPLETIARHLTSDEHPAAIPRFGLPGYDLWLVPSRLPFWLGKFPHLTPQDQSSLEVLYAIPAWGHELTAGLLPPEAGLDLTAIDYHKGCYIGQEIISRLRSVGRLNRHLVSLIQTEGPPVQLGDTLRSSSPNENIEVETSISRQPTISLSRTANHPLTGQLHALAYLHRNTPVGPFLCGPPEASATALLEVRKSLDD